jgi:hypothetical protein
MSEKVYNLGYYIGAIDRPLLWYNLWNIKKNLHLFNGKKMIAIAVMGDDWTTNVLANLSPEEREYNVHNSKHLVDRIIKYLDDSSITFFHTNNTPVCDSNMFVQIMGPRLENDNPDELTFYGHTKGVRYPGGVDPRMAMWTGIIYKYCFDFEDVKKKLWDDGFECYGALKRDGIVSVESGPNVPWHYSGAMYWFRHDSFFTRNWVCPEQNRGVMEYIIPHVIPTEKAYSPFPMPGYFRVGGDFYDLNNWRGWLGTIGSNLTEQLNSFGFDGNEFEGFRFTRHL